MDVRALLSNFPLTLRLLNVRLKVPENLVRVQDLTGLSNSRGVLRYSKQLFRNIMVEYGFFSTKE